MNIALLCIGDELLKGSTINTNLAFLGSRLLEIGIYPELSLEIRDRKEDIRTALDYAFSRTDTVLVSGGLGPTADDLTKEGVAEWFGVPMIRRPEAEQAIRNYWKNRHSGCPVPTGIRSDCFLSHQSRRQHMPQFRNSPCHVFSPHSFF